MTDTHATYDDTPLKPHQTQIIGMGLLSGHLSQIEEQMRRDYGFGNSDLKGNIWGDILRGSTVVYKVNSTGEYVVLETILIMNSDLPVVIASIKPPKLNTWQLLKARASAASLRHVAVQEPNGFGYDLRIKEIDEV